MANIKSIKKVETYLSDNKTVVFSNIIEGAKLPSDSVREVLSLLERYGKVNLISNGKVTMVQYLGDTNE